MRGFDGINTSRRDLVFVQMSMVIEGWLALVDVHVKVNSMAAVSSWLELVNDLSFVLMTANFWGSQLDQQ